MVCGASGPESSNSGALAGRSSTRSAKDASGEPFESKKYDPGERGSCSASGCSGAGAAHLLLPAALAHVPSCAVARQAQLSALGSTERHSPLAAPVSVQA